MRRAARRPRSASRRPSCSATRSWRPRRCGGGKSLLVDDAADGRHAFAEALRWRAYVAAPIVLETRVIGFLHGDRSEGSVTELDREALARFAEGFALVFERAVLRRRLRVQREELRQVANWADARVGELSDGLIELGADPQGAAATRPSARRPTRGCATC